MLDSPKENQLFFGGRKGGKVAGWPAGRHPFGMGCFNRRLSVEHKTDTTHWALGSHWPSRICSYKPVYPDACIAFPNSVKPKFQSDLPVNKLLYIVTWGITLYFHHGIIYVVPNIPYKNCNLPSNSKFYQCFPKSPSTIYKYIDGLHVSSVNNWIFFF